MCELHSPGGLVDVCELRSYGGLVDYVSYTLLVAL